MATEQGIVIKIDANGTWVKTTKSSACAGCSARGACQPGSGGEEMEVNALNEIGAKVGDRILLGIETASVLKVSFLLYVFPILVLILGALIGTGLASVIGSDSSAWAVVAGLLFFGAGLLFMRSRANRMAARSAYRPRIVRILR